MAECFAYTRKSKALGDPDDPALLDNHRSLLARLALSDGRTLAEVRTEVGSGETIRDRPVFSRLLEEIERLPRGSGGTLYCTDVMRLTRGSQSDAGRIIEALSRADIHVRTASRTYDLARADDRFMFGLEVLFSERELSEAKRRLAAGQREARLKGRLPNGTAPFGYRYSVEHKTLLPDPERFPILVDCCRRACVEPVWRLALEYGVPETCLRRALRNPTIAGYPARHYGPKDPDHPSRKSYVPIPRDQWFWPEVQNTDYPHACSREEWEALQAALDLRREQRPRVHQGEGWCRDRVQFEDDPGSVRLGSYAVSRNSEGNVMCLTYERSRRRGCPHLFIPRSIVHEAVETALTAYFTDPTLIPWLEGLERRQEAPVPVSVDVERASLTRSLADLRRRYQEAVDAEMDSDDANHYHALRERRKRLQDRLSRMEEELQTLEAKGDERQVLQALSGLPLSVLPGHFAEAWGELDGFRKRLLVNACLLRIEVTIETTRPPKPHRREVSRLEWQPWMSLSSA